MRGVEHGGASYLREYEKELAVLYPERCRDILAREADDIAD